MRFSKSYVMVIAFIGVILFALLAGQYLDYHTKCFFYSLSLSLKNILLMILPFVIIVFLIQGLINIGSRAYFFVALMVPLIVLSNFASTMTAYFIGQSWLQFSQFNCAIPAQSSSLQPLWDSTLKAFISNDVAMIIGIVVGLIMSHQQKPACNNLALKLFQGVNYFLNKIFLPLTPLLIAGFALNLQESGVLSLLITHYSKVLMGFTIICFSYICLLYGISQNFVVSKWLRSLQNMIPPMLTGFSSMSSAAALPLTLMSTHKNISLNQSKKSCDEHSNENKTYIVDAVVPLTVNVHLIGDCFAIPIFALAVMVTFNYGIPSWAVFSKFAVYFVIAKFAVAAVPGGGILVMLPILEHHLNFTPEMLSIMMALYLLFDPIITSANILGNGSFALICNKIFKRMQFRYV